MGLYVSRPLLVVGFWSVVSTWRLPPLMLPALLSPVVRLRAHSTTVPASQLVLPLCDAACVAAFAVVVCAPPRVSSRALVGEIAVCTAVAPLSLACAYCHRAPANYRALPLPAAPLSPVHEPSSPPSVSPVSLLVLHGVPSFLLARPSCVRAAFATYTTLLLPLATYLSLYLPAY